MIQQKKAFNFSFSRALKCYHTPWKTNAFILMKRHFASMGFQAANAKGQATHRNGKFAQTHNKPHVVQQALTVVRKKIKINETCLLLSDIRLQAEFCSIYPTRSASIRMKHFHGHLAQFEPNFHVDKKSDCVKVKLWSTWMMAATCTACMGATSKFNYTKPS